MKETFLKSTETAIIKIKQNSGPFERGQQTMNFLTYSKNLRFTETVAGLSPPPMESLATRVLAAVAALCLMLPATDLYAAQDINRNPGWPGSTLSGVNCFGFQGEHYGPFDYVTEKSKLAIVERAHFTPVVEQLVRGQSGRIAGDLDYTLNAFPNHHRALWAVSRYYLRKAEQVGFQELSRLEHNRNVRGTKPPPPECYFQRAKRFAPRDGVVSAIFGIYLHKRGKLDAALSEYRVAESKDPNNGELVYNMGLLFLDMDDLPLAKQYAKRATSLGYPLKGLQRKVKAREARPSPEEGPMR